MTWPLNLHQVLPALKLFPWFRPMLKAMFNGGEEGKAQMEGQGDMIKK